MVGARLRTAPRMQIEMVQLTSVEIFVVLWYAKLMVLVIYGVLFHGIIWDAYNVLITLGV